MSLVDVLQQIDTRQVRHADIGDDQVEDPRLNLLLGGLRPFPPNARSCEGRFSKPDKEIFRHRQSVVAPFAVPPRKTG